jgi:hypothetical protein
MHSEDGCRGAKGKGCFSIFFAILLCEYIMEQFRSQRVAALRMGSSSKNLNLQRERRPTSNKLSLGWSALARHVGDDWRQRSYMHLYHAAAIGTLITRLGNFDMDYFPRATRLLQFQLMVVRAVFPAKAGSGVVAQVAEISKGVG